jgi:hypothetical protein
VFAETFIKNEKWDYIDNGDNIDEDVYIDNKDN